MSDKSLEASVAAFNAALRGLRASADGLERRAAAVTAGGSQNAAGEVAALRAALNQAREEQRRETQMRKELTVKLDSAIARLRTVVETRDKRKEPENG